MVEIILGIGNYEVSLGEAATFDDISGFLSTNRVEGLDEALSGKANASEVYTKSETDTLLDNKANESDLANKQNTLTAGDNITIVDDVISASGSVDDVQINGTSIVVDKVANIETASSITVTSTGKLQVNSAGNTLIDRRTASAFISAGSIDYAVKQAMCDGKGEEWTEAEKANARARMGVPFKKYITYVLEEVTSLINFNDEALEYDDLFVVVTVFDNSAETANGRIQIDGKQIDTDTFVNVMQDSGPWITRGTNEKQVIIESYFKDKPVRLTQFSGPFTSKYPASNWKLSIPGSNHRLKNLRIYLTNIPVGTIFEVWYR